MSRRKPGSPAPDLTILVVSFNTCELTRACLASVYGSTRDVSFEVIVVDNASKDGSAEMIARDFPQARLLAQDSNLGFGNANNLARRQARGRWLLLLNPDTRVLDGSVAALLAFARSHPEAGIVGGRTLNPDGSLNPWSCRGRPTLWSLLCQAVGLTALFRGNRLFDPTSLGPWQRDSVREVDVVVGCWFLVSLDLWDRLGGFDPEFFMYGEETDFCLRARALGFRPMIEPRATIVHHGGASERQRSHKLIQLLKAHRLLFEKHRSRPAAGVGVALLRLWCWTRWAHENGLRLLRLGRARAGGDGWSDVWLRRAEWLTAGPDSSGR